MKHQNITITNYHPHGFAFGFEESNNEQVFIPINVAKGHNLEPGVKIFAHIAPNFADKSQRGTPWQAIRLHNAEVRKKKPCVQMLTQPFCLLFSLAGMSPQLKLQIT